MAASGTETREEEFPVAGYLTSQEFCQDVFKKIVAATQQANTLSGLSEDFAYWSSFSVFKNYCTEEGTRIINDIGELLRHHAVQCSWASGTSALRDTEERFDRLVDANDILLENVGSLLDEATGLKKNDKPIIPASMKQSAPIMSSWNKKEEGKSPYKLLIAKNIQRPQIKWLEKIDNSNIPFQPFLIGKPNALKPSDEDSPDVVDMDLTDDLINQQETSVSRIASQGHPYEYELSQFEPNDWQLEEKPPQDYLGIADTNLTIIDSQNQLNELMVKLKSVKEIAIDLEHHSYRSFQGFVCLMQLSTRMEDFIVDTLKLREELHVLNEVFTDPNILKVLHGSDSDIGWLQRDFGLYIVNMFDTGQAARTLHEERFSLAHLLQKYCNVAAQKQFQLADWRIRELPEEMIRYAREDTHYLLYIYDILRNQLLAQGNEMKNLLRSVYSKSTSLCSTLYKKVILYPDSHWLAYQKGRGRLNSHQLECFRLLYEWRDKTAREEDESYGYTLPNHMLFQIAENLPREPQGVIACCNPVPPLVKQRVMDIHQLVLKARDFDPLNKQGESNIETVAKSDIPMSHEIEGHHKHGTYDAKSGFERYKITGPPVGLHKPRLTVFDGLVKEPVELSNGKKKVLEILAMLRSPFEMYLPNTGKPIVQPSKINQTWTTASKEALKSQEKPECVIIKDQEDSDHNARGKRQRNEPVAEITLREMIPSKRKRKQQTDSNVSKSVPEKLDYTTNTKKSSSYIAFDYSKADLKKFSSGKSSSSTSMEAIDSTTEPKMGKVVRTKVHSKTGSRSMTSK